MTADEVKLEATTPSGGIGSSYERVAGKREWPVADRASMGLCFENVPAGYEHRRCLPMIKHKDWYVPHPDSLLEHKDTKYSTQLAEKNLYMIDTDHMFSLC